MDKLKMESLDITRCNIEKIGALFPNVLTETKDENGKLVKAINFDKLKQELTDDIIDGSEESYDFTWVGKTQAIIEANTPIRKTLRPVVEDETTPTGADSNGNPYMSSGSKNFDTTENLYIEGDNFEVLKLLQESYLNSIKMIYIDPPYNTGKDSFVYPDNFNVELGVWNEELGVRDDDDNILFKQNTETNGRFHSDWCSMIYQRLKLAKNLLTDDGVIFISIDDNEVENLKKICNEIFGESNCAAQFPWRKRTAKSDVPFGISQDYEWVLCYAKTSEFSACLEGGTRKYFESDDLPNRPWRIHDLTTQRSALERPNSNYTMVDPKTGAEYPVNPNRTWAVTKETFEKYYAENRIVFPDDYDFLNISKPAFRYFKEDDIAKAGDKFGFIPVSTKLPDEIGMTQDGTKEMTELFESKVFGFPKPLALMKYFIKAVTCINPQNNDIILDFFSGSATTAHAVMQLNAEDGGNRKFIMVQLPEVTDEKSEAYKAGYKNICEIGKERIRRAGKKINEELAIRSEKLKGEQLSLDNTITNSSLLTPNFSAPNSSTPNSIDTGFRVLKVDSTNMKDVYYSANEYNQATLDDMISNIKEDRNAIDLLYGVLLDWGIQLSSTCETLTIDGITVYNYDDGSLIACLDDKKVSETAIREIAKMQPLRVVFRDSSFANSPDKINVEEIFKLDAPNTSVRVI